MNKYLQELLKLSNTVIIPGLGALTITNDKTGELFFISYLKHDDGKLAEFIASKEEIELIDAKNNLAKYVREITANLDKGESFDIFNFGKFVKDGSGNIVFEQFTQNEHKLSESTFSTDVNEKLETQLEIGSETDSKKNQKIDSPTLDTILNNQIDDANIVKYFDEKIGKEESIKTEKIVHQENTLDKPEIIEKKELIEEKPTTIDSINLQSNIIEDEKEISFTKNTSIVDEIKEIPKPEELISTKNQIEKKSTTTINEINSLNDTTNSKVKADEKIDESNVELKDSTEKGPKKNTIETAILSPKKKNFKKRFIGIIIPFIIAAIAFLYPKFFNSSTKVKGESKVEEKTDENQDSSEPSKISSKNIPSKEEKVDETLETINTNPPVTNSTTPTPASPINNQPINKQPIQKQPVEKQLVTSNQSKSNLGVQIQIIVGSFKEKDNALKFNELLIQKGYKNTSIIENNEFFQICIGSFDVLDDAKNFSRTIKLPKGYWFKFVK